MVAAAFSPTPPSFDELLARLGSRAATVAIVGLGYVGLPLAVEFGEAGFEVIGLDVDEGRCAALNRGESHIADVPAGRVAALRHARRFRATADRAALAQADAVVICVPTPLNKTHEPDISFVVAAAESIAAHGREGQLVVLESTTYPGTTSDLLRPTLEAAGLTVGETVWLAYSPERIDPGNARFGVRNTPKVVGGTTPACAQLATALYGQIVERVVPVSSPEAAEMVKLLENTFRMVNIGLVNEVAQWCHELGIDVWEVVEAAATKPFGFMPFFPGPGLGGHCLSGDEVVFTRTDTGSGMAVTPLADLVTRLTDEAPLFYENGSLFLAPRNLEVLSFDPTTRETVWKPVQFVSRRAYDGAMVRAWTEEGRRLTVTDGHPMMVWDGEAFRTCRADQLQPGQELVVPLGQPDGEALSAHHAQPTAHRIVETIASYPALVAPVETTRRVVSPPPTRTGWREQRGQLAAMAALHDGFATVKVREVEPALSVEAVYSLEVEGTHTFITSFGLLVHNCIPIDPLYLSWKLRGLNHTARFIELAREINTAMPQWVVTRVADALNDEGKAVRGARILVLGVAYKPNVADLRESPALEILKLLHTKGARLQYADPFIPEVALDGLAWQAAPLSAEALREADCVLVVTHHSDFPWALVAQESRLIVDTRNALSGRAAVGRVVRL